MHRNAYVNPLEKASVGEDIAPFADFLAGLVRKRMAGDPLPAVPKASPAKKIRSAGSDEERSADRVQSVKLRIDKNVLRGQKNAARPTLIIIVRGKGSKG